MAAQDVFSVSVERHLQEINAPDGSGQQDAAEVLRRLFFAEISNCRQKRVAGLVSVRTGECFMCPSVGDGLDTRVPFNIQNKLALELDVPPRFLRRTSPRLTVSQCVAEYFDWRNDGVDREGRLPEDLRDYIARRPNSDVLLDTCRVDLQNKELKKRLCILNDRPPQALVIMATNKELIPSKEIELPECATSSKLRYMLSGFVNYAGQGAGAHSRGHWVAVCLTNLGDGRSEWRRISDGDEAALDARLFSRESLGGMVFLYERIDTDVQVVPVRSPEEGNKLWNQTGNSCFANSIAEVLRRSPAFVSALRSSNRRSGAPTRNGFPPISDAEMLHFWKPMVHYGGAPSNTHMSWAYMPAIARVIELVAETQAVPGMDREWLRQHSHADFVPPSQDQLAWWGANLPNGEWGELINTGADRLQGDEGARQGFNQFVESRWWDRGNHISNAPPHLAQ